MNSDLLTVLAENRIELENLLQKFRCPPSSVTLRRDLQMAAAAMGARIAVLREVLYPALPLDPQIEQELLAEEDAICKSLASLLAARIPSDIQRQFRHADDRFCEHERKLHRIAIPLLEQVPEGERKSLGFLAQLILEQHLGSDHASYAAQPLLVDRQSLLEEARTVLSTFAAKP